MNICQRIKNTKRLNIYPFYSAKTHYSLHENMFSYFSNQKMGLQNKQNLYSINKLIHKIKG